MEKIRKWTRAADRVLGYVTGVLAVLLLVYSAYVLCDNFYIGQNAFSSWDLQQYKPVEVDEEGRMDFTEIQKINPDAVGWVTIFNTNIDYPIMQGKDDLEYINKDLYGNSSLTGSIYLSAENDGEFFDSYNVMYGHHMDNGAMFGDVDKFADETYFMSHRKGELLTPRGVYDLNVFACLKTDAYNTEVYQISNLKHKKLDEIVQYLKNNADRFLEVNHTETQKIVAMSACANATTNGRVIIFCDAVPKKAVTNGNKLTKPVSTDHLAMGHNTWGSGWAVLNLVCVLIVWFTLLPLLSIRKKYRQISYSRRKRKDFNEKVQQLREQQKESPLTDEKETEMNMLARLVKDLRFFSGKLMVGTVGEILLAIAAVIVFLLTENMRTPMLVSDRWTGLMVGLAIIGLVIDFIFFRYRGHRLPDEEQTGKETEKTISSADADQNAFIRSK